MLLKIVFGLIFVVSSSCSNENKRKKQISPNAASQTDFSWLASNLFSNDCISCHSAGSSLASLETYEDLTDSSLVFAGQADASLLYRMIKDQKMPPRGGLTSSEALAVLECWINDGGKADSRNCIESMGLGLADETNTSKSQQPTPTQQPEKEIPDEEIPEQSAPPVVEDPFLYTTAVKEILTTSCISCHSSNRPRAGIDLSSYDSIILAEIVTPGAPKDSLLYEVLTDNSMPLNTNPLSDAEKKLIFDWILNGARK